MADCSDVFSKKKSNNNMKRRVDHLYRVKKSFN